FSSVSPGSSATFLAPLPLTSSSSPSSDGFPLASGHLDSPTDSRPWISDLLKITRDGCGTTKLCLASPDNCDPAGNDSCLFVSFEFVPPVPPTVSKVIFRLKGDSRSFITVGLTQNPSQGETEFFACMATTLIVDGVRYVKEFLYVITKNTDNSAKPDGSKTFTATQHEADRNILKCQFSWSGLNSSSTRGNNDLDFVVMLGKGANSSFSSLGIDLTTGLLDLSNPRANIPTTTAPTSMVSTNTSMVSTNTSMVPTAAARGPNQIHVISHSPCLCSTLPAATPTPSAQLHSPAAQLQLIPNQPCYQPPLHSVFARLFFCFDARLSSVVSLPDSPLSTLPVSVLPASPVPRTTYLLSAPDYDFCLSVSGSCRGGQLKITRDGCGTTELCLSSPNNCDPAGSSSCMFVSFEFVPPAPPNVSEVIFRLRGDSSFFITVGLTQNFSQTFESTQHEVVGNIVKCQFSLSGLNSSSTRGNNDLDFVIILGKGASVPQIDSLGIDLTTGLLDLSNPRANIPTTTAPTSMVSTNTSMVSTNTSMVPTAAARGPNQIHAQLQLIPNQPCYQPPLHSVFARLFFCFDARLSSAFSLPDSPIPTLPVFVLPASPVPWTTYLLSAPDYDFCLSVSGSCLLSWF
ncbi:hypothetical protein D4764_15G0004480, partial [Takifugu flavidus]